MTAKQFHKAFHAFCRKYKDSDDLQWYDPAPKVAAHLYMKRLSIQREALKFDRPNIPSMDDVQPIDPHLRAVSELFEGL